MKRERGDKENKKRGRRLRAWLRRAAGTGVDGDVILPTRRELLTGILLIALLVGIPLTFIPLLLAPELFPHPDGMAPTYGLLTLMVVVALGLNYRGRTDVAAWLLLLGTSLALLVGALLRTPVAGRALLFFLFIPLITGSALLPPRHITRLLLFNLLLILGFGLLRGSLVSVLLGPLVFQLFVFGLLALLFWYRRQEEEAARATARKEDIVYQGLLERAFDGVALLREMEIVEATPRFAALFGQTPAAMVGRPLAAFLTPAAAARVAALRETPPGEPVELTAHVAADGERHLELVAQPVQRGGRPARLVAARDVTERVGAFRATELVQHFAAGLRQAPDRAAMPAVITRLLLEMPEVTAAVLLTGGGDGLQPEAAAGFGLDGAAVDRAAVARAIAGGGPVWSAAAPSIIPLRVEQGDVGALVVLLGAAPAPPVRRALVEIGTMVARALQRAGAHQATRSYATELEERVAERTRALTEANQRLQELDRLKSKFVSDVSHELRTPVTSIKLYLDLLSQGNAARRPIYEQVLRQQASRLQALLEDILDLSRLDLRRESIQLQPLDLGRVVAAAVADYRSRAAAGGLVLDYRPVADLPPLTGHEQLLAQMVGNLLSNAISYTPSGRVDVDLVQAGAALQLTVGDTGPGIPDEDMPHVFERFYRGSLTAQSNIPGSGLGLALVADIVDIHGGSVTIKSRPGGGTVVAVRLPLAAATDENQEDADGRPGTEPAA